MQGADIYLASYCESYVRGACHKQTRGHLLCSLLIAVIYRRHTSRCVVYDDQCLKLQHHIQY